MMHKFLVITWILFGLFAVFSCNTNKAETSYQPVTKFDPGRDAARDIELAIAEAQRSGRRIILDVGGEWCIWCHRLDEFIHSHQKIEQQLNKYFVVVKVNYSKENKNEAVLSRYPKIAGYPHLFVLDSDGSLLHSQNTGQLELDKSYDEQKILEFIEKWKRDL